MPNLLAYLMLAAWPLVALVLYRRLSLAQATVWTLVAGYLLLPPPPAAFDFPLLPSLSKNTIPSLAAFVLALAFGRGQIRLWPRSRVAQVLLLVFLLSPIATWATNTDPVFFGRIGLPGLRPVEAVALVIRQGMLVIPFLLARALLAEEGGQRVLLGALAVGGLVYSVPMLLEVRFSPQLNIWVYGYFQHYFAQMIRGDGYRPIVFLYHGLWAAFFAFTAMAAALALARTAHGMKRVLLYASGAWMAGVLVLSKSLGSMLYGAALVPLLLFLRPRAQLGLAALLAVAALSYPLMKAADIAPREALIAQAERINPERAASLRFRLDNEEILFERANERPFFGWGTWGRNQLHDPVTGSITTVTDGRWIITLGVFGWVGLIAEMGLLTFPIFALWGASRRGRQALSPLVGAMALILAVNVIDLIPNATLTPMTWLFAGALLGVAERRAATAQAEDEAEPEPQPAKGLRTVL